VVDLHPILIQVERILAFDVDPPKTQDEATIAGSAATARWGISQCNFWVNIECKSTHINHIAVLVHCSPQVMLLAVDLHEYFINVKKCCRIHGVFASVAGNIWLRI
jgi:hypothetical protein